MRTSVTETGEQEIAAKDVDVADGASASWRSRRSQLRAVSRRFGATSLASRWEGMDAKHAIVLALVIFVVALTLAMPVRTFFAQRSEFNQLRSSNAQLRSQVADYQQKVTEQGDPAYVEAKARERLQFVRPGEKALVMMFPDEDARKAAQKQAEDRKNNPWYANLWSAVATPPTPR